MIDINKIRQHAEQFRHAIRNKRIPVDLDQLLELDDERRKLQAGTDDLRRERNQLSRLTQKITEDEVSVHLAKCKYVTDELEQMDRRLRHVNERYQHLLLLMPSLPTPDVPTGETDDDNVELKQWGEPRVFDFSARDHIELARMRELVLFDQAREFAGSRAYALTGNGALLELAVMRMAIDFLIARGYTLTMPPLAVKENAMVGTGYFPLGEDNAYVLEKDGLYLTGTSEVGLVSLQAERLFREDELPARFAGLSTCFRREAGAAGRDTRGLYRVHQFQKVEQVVFTVDDDERAKQEHENLLGNAEQILQMLELPYRVVTVCTGEMGLGQVRKHDIETWMPSRNAYGETHSCSTLGEFQARRLNIRYKNAAGQKRYVHTLNNTAVASPRILVALLENHQQPDGCIAIPAALRPYMGGRETI